MKKILLAAIGVAPGAVLMTIFLKKDPEIILLKPMD